MNHFILGVIFGLLSAWIFAVIMVAPMEAKIASLERKVQTIMEWEYVTPTPPVVER